MYTLGETAMLQSGDGEHPQVEKLQLQKIGKPEDWYSLNAVILQDGEIGIERRDVAGQPAYLMKVGDGTTVYAELPYLQAVAADVYSWAKNANLLDGVLATFMPDEAKTGRLDATDTLRDALNKIENAIEGHSHGGYLPVNRIPNIQDGHPCYICEGYLCATKVVSSRCDNYAEYRVCEKAIIPGTVVVQDEEQDIVYPCGKRMASGAMITSDTFGFAIGKTGSWDVPVAVSGRVLAYTDKPRESFCVGDIVCAGKAGTVSRMRRWEAILFPDRILGVVSNIPENENWHGIPVCGRICIRVR